jgi:hypothetical protein
MALTLPTREAKWQVNPASSAGPDIEAAEFVESCLHDMSFSWDDVLTEICSMFTFGWAYMEWVLKARMGANPSGGKPASQHDDGRIGFKSISLRGQASLHRWDIEQKTGKLKGMYQWAMTQVLHIPLDKSILFRTTKELNNPEGFSILRPAHRPWSYKRNVERIEAIGIQRAMQGLPVVKLLQGATKAGSVTSGDSTEERAEVLIQRLYDNTMLGVIEEADMEFRFEAPDMRGISKDSGTVIQRYDESIARAALAMYILLGTRERGSYALSRELGDLFFLAVEGFINMISQTFSRWGVPVLFRYNTFPGITGYPEVTTAINRRVDLEVLADFINKTTGAMVLTPDPELERFIREVADFPAPAVEVGGKTITPAQDEPSEDKAGPPTEQGQEEEAGRTMASRRAGVEKFATDQLSGYQKSTDAYQAGLRQGYEDWLGDVENVLKEEKDERELKDRWAILLLLGLAAMKRRGWEALPRAFALGYGSDAFSPEARAALEAEIRSNDEYLETHLWARVRNRISVHELEEIWRLYQAGLDEQGHEMLFGVLLGLRGNVMQYSGAHWRAIWVGSVLAEEESELPIPGEEEYEPAIVPIRWVMDALAEHCATCLVFGSREQYMGLEDLLATTGGVLPGQGTECDGWCRCHLEALRMGVWGLL